MTASYPLPLPTLRLTIAGEDRTTHLVSRTLQVRRVLRSQSNTATFLLVDRPAQQGTLATKPTHGQEVLVEVQTGAGAFVTLFGGLIQRVREERIATGVVGWRAECVDYTDLLTRRLVRNIYRGSITDIVKAIITEYAPRIRYSVTTVIDTDFQSAGIAFNYRYPKDCLDELASLINWEWYVDANKSLHFFDPALPTHAAAEQITDTSKNFFNLSIEPQLDQVRNRVWVHGGLSLSDWVNETFVANGSRTNPGWRLSNDNITQIEMLVDGVPQLGIGLQGTANEDDTQFLVIQSGGFSEVRYSEGRSAAATIADLALVTFRYRYKYPIHVMVEDLESQAIVAALSSDFEAMVLAIDDDNPSMLPVAYYQLAETSDGTAHDSSGNARHGSYSGFAANEKGLDGVVLGDPSNTSVSFDGSNNYVLILHDPALNLGGGVLRRPWAVAFWARHDPADTTVATYRVLWSKGGNLEARVNYLGPQIVSLHSSDYGAIGGNIDLGDLSSNNTGLYLPDGDFHFIVFAYNDDANESVLRGYVDSMGPAYQRFDFLQINNGANTSDLILGARSVGPVILPYKGQLDEVVFYDGVNVKAKQVRRLYDAAQEDGLRETVIVQNDLSHVSEARALAELELARWSRVITQVNFSSYVAGWQEGETVTVNVTKAATGRNFAGGALIQAVSISALGAQRLKYDVECSAARFSLIDFFRQLLNQDKVSPGTEGPDIAIIDAVDDSYQDIVLVGIPIDTDLGTTFRVAPDWGSGTPPYISPEFWVVDPNAF